MGGMSWVSGNNVFNNNFSISRKPPSNDSTANKAHLICYLFVAVVAVVLAMLKLLEWSVLTVSLFD